LLKEIRSGQNQRKQKHHHQYIPWMIS